MSRILKGVNFAHTKFKIRTQLRLGVIDLNGFFESYLRLSNEEETQLQTELEQLPKEEEVQIMEMISSWERRGIEKGMEKGIEKGIEKGLSEGERKKAIEVALNLLKEGVDVPVIMRATGLTQSELEKLAQEMNSETNN